MERSLKIYEEIDDVMVKISLRNVRDYLLSEICGLKEEITNLKLTVEKLKQRQGGEE